MLRQVVNFFITGFILWAAWRLFPQYVEASGFGAIVLATIVLFIVELIISLIAAALVVLGVISTFNGTFWSATAAILLCVAFATLAEFIALTITSNCLSSFEIADFWPKMIIVFCISFFTIPAKSQNKN